METKMSDSLKVTSDACFEKDVLQSSSLVLVDFWAPWCQPCRAIMPLVELFAENYAAKGLVVYKLNVDENSKTPSKYGIQGIPSLLLFKNGVVVATHVGGNVSKAILAKLVDEHLGA
jgi:thioredoxin 1